MAGFDLEVVRGIVVLLEHSRSIWRLPWDITVGTGDSVHPLCAKTGMQNTFVIHVLYLLTCNLFATFKLVWYVT